MRYSYSILLLLSLALLFPPFTFTQDELDTVLTDEKGNEITIPPDVNITVENPTEETRTFIFTPKEENDLARAQINRDDEISKFSGKTITYTTANERFLIEGNAAIETESETLKGPSKIQFDPEKNFMLVEGTPDNWAEFHYTFPDGRVMHSYGKEFRFYFETIDGKRELKRIEKRS